MSAPAAPAAPTPLPALGAADERAGASPAAVLPDAAVAAIVAQLGPSSLAALRLASRGWAADVARCVAGLSVTLPSTAAAAGAGAAARCCPRHAHAERRRALKALPCQFGGIASLELRVPRDAAGCHNALGRLSLAPLERLPRLTSLSLQLHPESWEARGASPSRAACRSGRQEAEASCWACDSERLEVPGSCCRPLDLQDSSGSRSRSRSSSPDVAPASNAAAPAASLPAAVAGGLSALSRLTSLRLLGRGVYAPAPGSSLLEELASLPLTHLDTDALEQLPSTRVTTGPPCTAAAAPPAGASHGPATAAAVVAAACAAEAAPGLSRLAGLRSLRLRLPYLARRGVWLEVACMAGLAALRVDVARCAPGCRFHLRDAVVPLGCLPGLRELSLGGFHALTDRDLALAALLRGLTSLRLRQRDGPYHGEEPTPGGGVGREGAAALAQGLPGLSDLALVGASVASDALAALLAGLTGLRALDLSGTPQADDGLLLEAGASFSGLTSLRLAHCPGVSDVALLVLSKAAPLLQSLDVSGATPLPMHHAAPHAAPHAPRMGLGAVAAGVGGAVTDAGVSALSALRALRELCLDGRRHVTDAGIRALLHPRPLSLPRTPSPLRRALAVAPTPAPPTPPAGDALEPQTLPPPPLEVLSLSDCCGLTDAALAALAPSLTPTLRVLRLDNCSAVTNRGLRALLPLTELEELSLKGTLVQPQGPGWRTLSQRVRRIACDPAAGLAHVGLLD